MSVIIGIFSFISNGIADSTAFSAVIAARNPEVEAFSKGHSMGSLPLDEEMAKMKLRFRELENGAAKEMAGVEGSVHVKHWAFEFEYDVVTLRRAGFIFEELGLGRG
ncbi:hypothetical protein EAF04_001788 [Stromatinia cepivora]|nr:hypothetical protein EAF04_001788 [Stromatinia cepivora]